MGRSNLGTDSLSEKHVLSHPNAQNDMLSEREFFIASVMPDSGHRASIFVFQMDPATTCVG